MQYNKGNSKIKIWAVLFWLVVWQITAMIIDQEIFLVSPGSVFVRLFELILTGDFWRSVRNSFLRIVSGFAIGLFSGVILAILASKIKLLKDLLAPFIMTIKSIPVASFVILSLFWFSSQDLGIFISFLVVLPVVYINMLEGISTADAKLLEMARVFGVSGVKKIRYIYIFEVYPFFHSALSVALGLCWKSGIAGEVIGIPDNSIGEHLFMSKSFFDIASLFAWTVVIIIISVAFEKAVLFLLTQIKKQLERA